MKIAKIHLQDYLNFEKQLVLDLTYPPDHPTKSNKPLDKVCLIGQTGTGKTNLLNLIKYFTFESKINPFCIDPSKWKKDNIGIEFLLDESDLTFSKWSSGVDELSIPMISYRSPGINNADCKYIVDRALLEGRKVKLINFPFDLIRTSTATAGRPPSLEAEDSPEEFKKSLAQKRQEYLERVVWDFSTDDIFWLWNIVRDQIEEYEREYKISMKRYVDQAENDPSNSEKYIREFSEWKNSVSNPLKNIADRFEPFFKKFNLKVKTDIDFADDAHKEFIRVEQLNDNVEVPFSFLSTGARQILYSSLPLSVLNLDKAIVLFDEPEHSLYPDAQIELIKAYTKRLPNSQFFFATHSPIVASAFEPWEIVEFVFDPDTKFVTIERYYKGDRRVSNYRIHPQYLTYGDIYMDVFDLIEEGNPDFRKPEEEKLLRLKAEFEKMKNVGTSQEELEIKLKEITDVARKLRYNMQDLFSGHR